MTTLRARAVRVPENTEVWARCRKCGSEIQLLGTDWHHPDEAKHAAEPDHSVSTGRVSHSSYRVTVMHSGQRYRRIVKSADAMGEALWGHRQERHLEVVL